jgi:hypothetical protein
MRVDEQTILVCRIDVRRRDAVHGHACDLLFLDRDLQTLGQGLDCRYGGLVCRTDKLDPFLIRLKGGALAACHIRLWCLCNGVSERIAYNGWYGQRSFLQYPGFFFRQCLPLNTDDQYQQCCDNGGYFRNSISRFHNYLPSFKQFCFNVFSSFIRACQVRFKFDVPLSSHSLP